MSPQSHGHLVGSRSPFGGTRSQRRRLSFATMGIAREVASAKCQGGIVVFLAVSLLANPGALRTNSDRFRKARGGIPGKTVLGLDAHREAHEPGAERDRQPRLAALSNADYQFTDHPAHSANCGPSQSFASWPLVYKLVLAG